MGINVSDSMAGKFMNYNKCILPKTETIKSYDHCIKGDALMIKNRFFDAIDEYLTSLAYDDLNIDAYKGLGFAYKQVGYTKCAIEAFKAAKEINSFDKNIYYELGSCYSIENCFCKAQKYFIKAIKLDPDFTDAIFNLGIAYELNNEISKAEFIYKELMENDPSYTAAYNNLAGLYMKKDLFTQAIKIFKSLLKINPEFTRAHLGIAIAYEKTGRSSRSLRYYRKYMELKPQSTNIPYILDRLDYLKCSRKNKSLNLKVISG